MKILRIFATLMLLQQEKFVVHLLFKEKTYLKLNKSYMIVWCFDNSHTQGGPRWLPRDYSVSVYIVFQFTLGRILFTNKHCQHASTLEAGNRRRVLKTRRFGRS